MLPEKLPPETIILEPQKILNKAIVKFDKVLYYSYSKLIDCYVEIFTDPDECPNEIYWMSVEWISYNIENCQIEYWPILIYDDE